jgi:tetratricopeptide (TPR) repeat protein
MPLEPGTSIGPYEIRGLLGAGGMGEVYLAWDPRLGREVALKRMTGPGASDAEGRARFMVEARAVAALEHPGIVAIHDILWEDGAPYLVMERLEGETLRERLCPGPLPAEEARSLWLQAVRAVAEAHRQGVIHRDLKPENLFLTTAGAVKVLDFGLAKRLDGTDATATHPLQTQEGVLMGTLAYLSPEQARGEPATRRSDVHALGLILLEMLTGRPAFRKDTAAETLAAILAEDPLRGLSLPPWAEPLLQGALAKDPARRPADAAALEEEPTRTLPLGVPAFRRAAFPRRAAWALALAGCAGAAFLGWRLWPRRPSASTDATRSPGWAALQRAEYLREHRDWSRDGGVALAEDPVVLAYREALRLDPELLEAHLGLGEHLVGRVFFLKGGEAAAPEAFEHIQRVLQARPDHPEALSLRGRLAFSLASGFRLEQALEDLLRATRLDPAGETTRYHLGSMCEHAGLLPEAGRIYESSKVAKGVPGGGPAFRLARVRWMAMDLEASRGLYEAEPPDRQWELPAVLERLGRPAEALARLESLETLSKGDTDPSKGSDLLSIRAYLEARRGLATEARRHAAASEAQGRGNAHFHHAAYHLACAYAALGDEAQALRLLRAVADGGMPCYPLFLKDPGLDPLRASPAFQVFLEAQRVRHEGFRKLYASS